MSLDLVRQKYNTCERCPALCASRTQVVFGSGDYNSPILFIGEAPGAHEDKQGIPFCGMSGKILSELLGSVGLTREDVFVTNTILCRPENNRPPAKEEVEQCRERLDKVIGIMKPKIIVTIGNHATERILGKSGVTSMHGKVFPTIIAEIAVKVVPVIHPANYLYSGRSPELLQQMKNDFKTISELLTMEKSQKTLGSF